MIDNKELKKETDYLKTVLYILEKEIATNSKKIGDITEDLQNEMKYAWDPTNRLIIFKLNRKIFWLSRNKDKNYIQFSSETKQTWKKVE